VEAGESECDAPGEERNAEIRGDFEQELFDPVFLGSFDGKDGVVGVDKKAEVFPFGGVGVEFDWGVQGINANWVSLTVL